jgi:hypothetical protein
MKVLHTIDTFEFTESDFPSGLPEGYNLSHFKIDQDERLILPLYQKKLRDLQCLKLR